MSFSLYRFLKKDNFFLLLLSSPLTFTVSSTRNFPPIPLVPRSVCFRVRILERFTPSTCSSWTKWALERVLCLRVRVGLGDLVLDVSLLTLQTHVYFQTPRVLSTRDDRDSLRKHRFLPSFFSIGGVHKPGYCSSISTRVGPWNRPRGVLVSGGPHVPRLWVSD